MSVPILGFIISGAVLSALFVLFRYEQDRGVRVLHGVRERFDTAVVRLSALSASFSRFFGRRMIRQTIHYLFHKMLKALLQFIKRCEQFLKRILHTNKMIAHKLEQDADRPKNKLDEIAEHKQSVALSETEKKKRKQKSLEG